MADLSEDDKLKQWYKAVIHWELPALNKETIKKLLEPKILPEPSKKEEINPFLAEDLAAQQEKKRKEEEKFKQSEEVKKEKQEESKKKSEE